MICLARYDLALSNSDQKAMTFLCVASLFKYTIFNYFPKHCAFVYNLRLATGECHHSPVMYMYTILRNSALMKY